jgi:IS5 family transposase
MQTSFLSLATHRQQPRAGRFLDDMEKVMPWKELCAIIAPHYRPGKTGRKPYPLETMLRVHFLQQWYDLSDPLAEQEIADRMSFQRFLKLDPLCDSIPDETTILNFRRLIEDKKLAPASTKNKSKARDPEMSSTKKGENWHFGIKAHIGVDARSGLAHSVEVTTASVHDHEVMDKLKRGDERALFGDKGYYDEKRKREARKHGVFCGVLDKAKRGAKGALSNRQQRRNRKKSSVRAKVEFPFRVVKRLWGHMRTRYRGIAKNAAQFTTLFALSNLYLVRKKILCAA